MRFSLLNPIITLIIFGISQAWAGPPNVVLSDANRNTAGGENALFFTGTGTDNTAFGFRTLIANGAGRNNSGLGASALLRNTTGHNNTAAGYRALLSNNTGIGNTAVGVQALMNKAAGNFNLALGMNAGSALKTGGNNIYLNSPGVSAESSTIRIGTNSGTLSHARAFIAGIRGIKTGLANAVPVVIDSNGQLGTVNSSARFKKDIRDMDEASQNLMKLRPVTYRYKEADDSGVNPLEYGLIAEEVAKIYPDLVAYGADGKIETVHYQKLTPMLLNELQHLNAQLESEKLKTKQLTDELAGMKARLQEVADLKSQVKALQTQAQTIQALTSRLSRIEARQTVVLQENALPSANNRHLY